MVRCNCNNCGQFVWRYPSEINTGYDGIYCSQDCFRGKMKRTRIYKNCATCGQEFYIVPSQSEYESSKYCSKKCRKKDGCYTGWISKYPKTAYLRELVRLRQHRENLHDTYVKTLLYRSTGLKSDDIPQNLIELKRLNVTRKRLIRNHNQKS